MLRHVILILLLLLNLSTLARAQTLITDHPASGDFPLADKSPANILIDPADFKVVHIAADLLVHDVERVTGQKPTLKQGFLKTDLPTTNTLFAGTLGHSRVLDDLIKSKKINISAIQGKWESYLIAVIPDPIPGISLGLVVIGSDRRGTAYGLLQLSEEIGVSPWEWWADVPPRHRDTIFLHAPPLAAVTHGPPSVKYRGIFINDEDWGMHLWASKTFEPESAGEGGGGGVGDIGPKTYAKIFELLLRLKANFCWPAMHDVTKAFNIYPQNKQVADDYAIVMGSSHCEPMLRNNVSEWTDAQGRVGQRAEASYNYVTNRDGVLAYWKQRIQENAKFENVYTLGMRGIHDSDMLGGGTPAQRAERLNHIMADQRDLLTQFVNKDVTQIPQIFCPYKEVLTLYQAGAVPPPDVTLVWADDNFGYIRRLSTPEEQKRPGGSGVYYHLSYWGAPHDYLWLCTTPPSLVWEELSKAYDYGARTLWVVNVGDLKPAEIDITLAMQMAYDIKSYSVDTIANFAKDFALQNFGPEHADEIAAILKLYYLLNFQRKPEHLGFNRSQGPANPVQPTPFSLEEIAWRLSAFEELVKQTNALYQSLPANQRDAFYELVTYPVRCSSAQNEKLLMADMIDRLEKNSQGLAGWVIAVGQVGAAVQSKAAYDSIQKETAYYNDTLAAGKWKLMMSDAPRNADVFKMPQSAATILAKLKVAPAPTTQDSPAAAPSRPVQGSFVEKQGIVSMDAVHFTRKSDATDSHIKTIPDLGRYGDAITIFPTTAPSFDDVNALKGKAPELQYDFTTANAPTLPDAKAAIEVEAVPTHRINPDHGLRYAIALDDETPVAVNLESPENSAIWSDNVLRNAALGTTHHTLPPGKHTLHLYMMDPGVILDHITINLGGRQPSYLAPPETRALIGKTQP